MKAHLLNVSPNGTKADSQSSYQVFWFSTNILHC